MWHICPVNAVKLTSGVPIGNEPEFYSQCPWDHWEGEYSEYGCNLGVGGQTNTKTTAIEKPIGSHSGEIDLHAPLIVMAML